MILQTIGWLGRLLLILVMAFIVSNCTMLGLNYASLDTANKPAPEPSIEAASLSAWTAVRGPLKQVFEQEIYGPWPNGLPARLVSRRIADPDYAGGRGVLEELVIHIGNGDGARRFHVGLALPKRRDGPLPLIIGQTFSSNCPAFASTALTGPHGAPCTRTELPWLAEYIFGEYIVRVPVETYFDAGFAYANFYAAELVPDSSAAAPAVMAGMANGDTPAPTGTLMAWAYGFSAIIDVLAPDDRIDASRIGIFGHSRHAKSALLAGAWDRRIAAVVAHQSGFGGAALSRSTTGEGIGQMLEGPRILPGVSPGGYPHWFAPRLADYVGRLGALPVDQHQLLALNAPTPVFLGNGRRDVWSDPNSTFRAAAAASEVYALYGATGLGAARMTEFRPGDGLAYFLRPGGHGTDQRDITAILAFLQAHLGAPVLAEGLPKPTNPTTLPLQ